MAADLRQRQKASARPRTAEASTGRPQTRSSSASAQSGSASMARLGRLGTAASAGPKIGAGRTGVPRARRMQLSLTRVEPWSVAKVTFLLSIAGAIIQVIASSLLWMLLNAIGLFDNINQMVSKTGLDAGGLDLSSVLSLGTVISSVTIFSIFEIVFIVVLATIGAFLYNIVGSLVGGIHVTLGDD
ncbi:DUF3566 domain-containing protein [Bifidobacterium xylocopae]